MSAADFELWEKELADSGIKLPRKKEKINTPLLLATAAFTAGCVSFGLYTATPSPTPEPKSVASESTFSYSFGQDEATATFPTPRSRDGSETTVVQFACDSSGALVVTDESFDYKRRFSAEDIAGFISIGMVDSDPCTNGLQQDDARNLGRIAADNGFATYTTSS